MKIGEKDANMQLNWLTVMLTSRVTFDLQGPPSSTGWTRKVYPAGITILVRAGKEQAISQTSLKA